MTKNEFLQRFNLKRLADSSHQYQYPGQLKHAAVLVLLIEKKNQDTCYLEVLLTKRAPHLRHHAGQICFPGGKTELFDTSLQQTALREAYEEIGLAHDNIEVIGQLHPYQTISGYLMTPIVALLKHKQTYNIDKNEVSEIFSVPLTHFLEEKNHLLVTTKKNNINHQVHFMPYRGQNIWGATAAILKDLTGHIM